MGTPLTDAEYDLLRATDPWSNAWNDICNVIKAERGGEYPSDWCRLHDHVFKHVVFTIQTTPRPVTRSGSSPRLEFISRRGPRDRTIPVHGPLNHMLGYKFTSRTTYPAYRADDKVSHQHPGCFGNHRHPSKLEFVDKRQFTLMMQDVRLVKNVKLRQKHTNFTYDARASCAKHGISKW